MPKLTICIPAYNSERTLAESIESALEQNYPDKEVLVIDDGSTDATAQVARLYDVRLILNEKNEGIGLTLAKLMKEAQGKYVIYLCADDVFTDKRFAGDVVHQFDTGDSDIGVLGRYFYFFRDGYPGAIGVSRDENILTQSCCPSGMAFRKMEVEGTNKIFVEMPYIVSQYLKMWRWSMFKWDVVAARFHPGGNTGTKKSYYTESPFMNWLELLGQPLRFNEGFIQLKNRAPHLLWQEIRLTVKHDPDVLKIINFWLYALVALLVPSFILRHLTSFYRHRINRNLVKIIMRGEK